MEVSARPQRGKEEKPCELQHYLTTFVISGQVI